MADQLYLLPPSNNIETLEVLRKLALAHRHLAELKGISESIPNQGILINTLVLQEAKDSSAIENIITTHDDLFRNEISNGKTVKPAVKEVSRYNQALKVGFDRILPDRLLKLNDIVAIQNILEGNQAGFRTQPGTELRNDLTGEIVYVPPQHPDEIKRLMGNLETYINDVSVHDVDVLVKMAIIHHRFETIHPFYDGNGRTGRIINVLYLVAQSLLDIPVLYMSRYIVRTKDRYYSLLQSTRDTDDWEPWILYMLEGVAETSKQTVELIRDIKVALMDYKHRIRADFKFYSQDLINHLFYHPYTKIDFLKDAMSISRITATKYLETLTEAGFLNKRKIGRTNYYVNIALMRILGA